VGASNGMCGLDWTSDGRIVTSQAANGLCSLWLMNSDGTLLRQLTSDPGIGSIPSVCADGRYILYQSNRGGGLNIWRANPEGENPTQLTHGGLDQYPSCAPDGRWLTFDSYRAGKRQVWRIAIDGGDPTRLIDGTSLNASISPNGEWIACADWSDETQSTKLGVYPATGGKPLKILMLPATASFMPFKWTADSRSVTYINTRAGVSNIWAQPIDGGPAKQLTDFTSDSIFTYAWSKDGKQLALVRGTQTKDAVLIRNFGTPAP
jgi:Tol biopolymer transport system component